MKEASWDEVMAVAKRSGNKKVVLVSYNEISGFKSGAYHGNKLMVCANDVGRGYLTKEDGTLDQEIKVKDDKLCNNLFESKNPDEAFKAIAEMMEDTEKNRQADDKRAVKVMARVAKQASQVILKDAEIVFIYSGLHACEEALALARSVKKSKPAAQVFVIACMCDWRAKIAMLHGADISLAQCECGGRRSMGVLAKLVSRAMKRVNGK